MAVNLSPERSHEPSHEISPAKAPQGDLITRTPRLDHADADRQRRVIRDYFIDTFDRYTQLFDALKSDAAFYQKPISLRHPLIFYVGHTATFFINKLMLSRLVDQRLDEYMESIFAVGVDEMSWDDLDDTHYRWPSVQAVFDYRAKVRATVLDVIDRTPLTTPIHWDHPWWTIVMGIEHERIHLETSSVLIRQQALEHVQPIAHWAPCDEAGAAPDNRLVPVAGGKVSIAKPRHAPYYGWDNEYEHHEAEVEPFEAAKFLVSNQEFKGFIDAGGYQNPVFWQEEGWQWRSFEDRQHPEFWVNRADGWHLRLMTEEVPMPWNWPVDVNYHEAQAFCQWKSHVSGWTIRLPTEDEWHRLHDVSGAPGEDPQEGRWNANIHLDHWASSCPVDMFRHGDFYDVVGNVWQWTETPTYPFDGFRVHPCYDDFTMPTFDGQHNLIKGGAWASCGNEAQIVSRYAFRRHFFQHAGFRYIKSDAPVKNPSSHYETDRLMSEYAEFHYGDSYFGVPNFPKALVELLKPYFKGLPSSRALDLGCASGRASFELARYFAHVDGVDFSARFIQQGVQLNQEGELRYTLQDEGELKLYRTRKLADMGLDGVPAPTFMQGDACNLKPRLTGYDLVFAANLIDRLYEPAKFLDNIHARINPGGLLMIASPYTWLEAHTPRENWLGGFKKSAENYTTLDGLKDHLGEHFELLDPPVQVPFVIRETRHKFQHTLSEVTVWRRKAD
ncbi:MAG: 5-histidylcysteine sulfoxide synthase [Halomonas sp.]|nr:5-histidylcysteine sulfoxide synthase [Halomonas sp.]MDN6298254.1 5-histidylcysteine sulfoxide synthase [Halomonas sp.]MDN6315494.1 5-histidylcysteine sulfoxide synthase [Halomonas sp.]MDN6336843.1 5-histidylcysteine sulfoxide synthase [Halomonas sp.]